MAEIDKNYHKLLETILKDGFKYEDPNRKGVNRIQIPSYQFKHDFKDGFPAITTKKLYWKGIVGELLWILRGEQNIKYLVDNDINIWNKDAYNYYINNSKGYSDYDTWLSGLKQKNGHLGDIGRGYGAQLRNWCGNKEAYGSATAFMDQFAELINTLKTNPMVTKKTVTFWNPAEKDECALTPCHWSFEILVEPLINECEDTEFWYSEKKGCGCSELDSAICTGNYNQKYQFTLKWHQHSCDVFLGEPFNIASYALLAHIIGKMTNMIPKGIIGDLSNVHIYEPHLDAVKDQLSRDVDKYGECELLFTRFSESKINLKIDDFLDKVNISDFQLRAYKSYPKIPAEMLAYSK